MVIHVIIVLPPVKQLKAVYPDVTQPWCTDNDGALGTFDNIRLYFNLLKQFVLGHEYYPEPFKIVIIVHPNNVESRKDFGLRHGFTVCTGAHYLGCFIGDD